MPSFPGLDPFEPSGTFVDRAQRFLASAYDSVAALFDRLYPLVRGQRDARRGRLTHAEQDIFRAAIVFAGAGLDSTLKELVRQAVPLQVERSDEARKKFRDFATSHISGPQGANAKAIAEVMISPDPRGQLLEAYVKQLTGTSLQSVQQVRDTLTALGLGHRQELYREAQKLQQLFEARNQVAHELDLKAPERRGDRSRRERTITVSKDVCHTGLNYAQRVINSIVAELGTDLEDAS
jgi:hypothetical protein